MNMLLGEKLKKARKNIGMSQNEVAEELMLSRQTISKWENNVCLPDLENFQRICKLYKVDFNTILSKDEGKIIYNIDKSEKEEDCQPEDDVSCKRCSPLNFTPLSVRAMIVPDVTEDAFDLVAHDV